MKKSDLLEKINKTAHKIKFSGTFYVKSKVLSLTESYGYANRSEKIKNQSKTRYGIASGCKIFTAIAICQLVEEGKISFSSKLNECIDIDFPYFDQNVTIQQLLTHTSGIPDYFDEEEMDNYEELWVTTPMYHIRDLQDFLPLFQNKKMQDAAGSTFHYNNAGYIVLGLIVEKVSGLTFSDYIERFVFQKAGMMESGYFEMDELPAKVALGYVKKPDGGWKTNTYSLPAKSASDGGAYVTAEDMIHFWEALLNGQLLTPEMTQTLLKSTAEIDEDLFYGYGVYILKEEEAVVKYILMGYDPGVNFRSVYYPDKQLSIVVCSNESDGAYEILKEIEVSI
ncbi:serine hydrolase domain-containing protein [Cytobacillus gottheilii]|uniref:Serine hydrolase n=1 Tax=Cytobacillus gottheilii TaxID=859144 RepID=A0ABX8F5Q0_9BACI|nr:serine hydrolase [Cytobacillus gottheilii]QVY59684.1 serine hydrolase [Cytobacillus gottheilii]